MQPISSKTIRQRRHKNIPKEDWQELKAEHFIRKQLIAKNGAVCAICGRPIIDMKDCTIDHIIPLSHGGLTTLENCQLAHRQCNLAKGDEYPD